jgi:ABC-type glycerol-3-phosphate transport system permease component
MVCQACGAPVGEGLSYCAQCGARVSAVEPAAPGYSPYPSPLPFERSRVGRHVQTLGILWCAYGIYRVAAGLIGMFVLRVMTVRGFGFGEWPLHSYYHGGFGPPWIGSLLPFVAFYTAVTAALALMVGYSLLTRRMWGRTLAIVVGILTLLKPFFGTALGIYTLWVLASSDSGVEYDTMAVRS